ncbi:hypothetical protein Tco_0576029 [Tanacetum coccineum]
MCTLMDSGAQNVVSNWQTHHFSINGICSCSYGVSLHLDGPQPIRLAQLKWNTLLMSKSLAVKALLILEFEESSKVVVGRFVQLLEVLSKECQVLLHYSYYPPRLVLLSEYGFEQPQEVYNGYCTSANSLRTNIINFVLKWLLNVKLIVI